MQKIKTLKPALLKGFESVNFKKAVSGNHLYTRVSGFSETIDMKINRR